jgi:tol-pal system protein YbgF
MLALRIALAVAALGVGTAQAGMFDDDEARRQIKDLAAKSEARFDQQGKAQLDLANQLSRQAEEIARLRGQVESLGYELETAKKRQQDFYLDLDSRLRKLEGGGTAPADAAALFGAFIQKAPDSSLAPNAQFWLGNAWIAQRDCKRAIEAHSVVTTKYADSPKAADSWLAMANCQQEMGSPAVARRSLETLVAKYPNAPAADTARERLKKK